MTEPDFTIEDYRQQLLNQGLDDHDSWEYRTLGDIMIAVIHHTAGNTNDTPEQIAQRQMARDFGGGVHPAGICYHFLVYENGRIVFVADLESVRWHISNLNWDSVGIALVGNFMTKSPTQRQIAATNFLLNALWTIWGISLTVKAHRDWAMSDDPTSCPGNTYTEWFSQIHQD